MRHHGGLLPAAPAPPSMARACLLLPPAHCPALLPCEASCLCLRPCLQAGKGRGRGGSESPVNEPLGFHPRSTPSVAVALAADVRRCARRLSARVLSAPGPCPALQHGCPGAGCRRCPVRVSTPARKSPAPRQQGVSCPRCALPSPAGARGAAGAGRPPAARRQQPPLGRGRLSARAGRLVWATGPAARRRGRRPLAALAAHHGGGGGRE